MFLKYTIEVKKSICKSVISQEIVLIPFQMETCFFEILNQSNLMECII